MGIYDRSYSRDEGRTGGRVGSVGMFSVNTWIIIINVLVFVLQAIPNTPLGRWIYELGHFSTYYIFGKTAGGYIHLQVWRLVTFQFLHAGVTHIFFNMFGLWIFGGLVEQYLGAKKYAAFYLVCGIFGGLTYLLLNLLGQGAKSMGIDAPVLLFENPTTPLVGASAGVFGVIMACAFIAPNTTVQLLFPPVPLKMRTMAYAYVAIAAFNLLIGGKNAGGDAAHLGGAVAGYFFIRRSHLLRDFFDVFKDSRKEQPRSRAKPATVRPADVEIDRILAKVNDHGLHSLTEAERRTLSQATEAKRNAG